jgi:protein-disulfide isomerase
MPAAQTVSSRPTGRLNALAAVSLLGLGISIYQSALFYALRGGTAGFKSACNLGGMANCDAVLVSRYAELIFGIPLSSFAAGWYVGLFIVVLFAKNAFWRRDALRVALGMSAFSALMAVIYLGIMLTVLHAICLFCLGVDACGLASLGITLSLRSEWSSPVKPDREKMKTLAIAVLASLIVAAGGSKMLDPVRFSGSLMTEKVDEILASPALSVGSGDEFPSMGAKDAPVTIVEFSDFQCPFCRMGAMYLKTVQERYPGKVRVVFRAFPLDPSCNASVEHSMHPVACDAARVAFCARKQGKFEAVYEHLFEHQAELENTGDGRPEKLALGAGIDSTSLPACMSSPDIQTAIARDVEEGLRLGVQTTPTFFINGHKIEGAYPVPVWNMLVDRLLAASPGTH